MPLERPAEPIFVFPIENSTIPFGVVDPLDGLTVAVKAIVKPWSACGTEDVKVVSVPIAEAEGEVGGALIVTSRLLAVDGRKPDVPA